MTPDAGGTNVSEMKFVGGNVPADLKGRLEAVAEANERTVAQELRIAIREYVERHERRAA